MHENISSLATNYKNTNNQNDQDFTIFDFGRFYNKNDQWRVLSVEPSGFCFIKKKTLIIDFNALREYYTNDDSYASCYR